MVGLLGFLTDMIVTFSLKNKVRGNKYMANSIGFLCGCTINYTLNKLWTFNDKNGDIINQFTRYVTISAGGLFIANMLICILTNKVKVNFFIAKIASVVVVSIWNFIMNYCFTFRQF
jgi:putative flippase GtrA